MVFISCPSNDHLACDVVETIVPPAYHTLRVPVKYLLLPCALSMFFQVTISQYDQACHALNRAYVQHLTGRDQLFRFDIISSRRILLGVGTQKIRRSEVELVLSRASAAPQCQLHQLFYAGPWLPDEEAGYGYR